jgi:glycolate oxidase
MERDAIVMAMEFAGRGSLPMDEKTEAHLLIEVDGFNMDLLYEDCEKISEILSDFDVGEILIADNEKDKEALWHLRSRVAEAVKAHSVYKEEDTVVPRAFLPELIDKVKEIGNKYGFRSICYGHAGDGNLHVNILKGNLSEDFWNDGLREALRELFTEVRKLGGTISGEHGIGLVQKEFLPLVFSPAEIAAMKNIKKIFDPGNILNPGKIFPEDPAKNNPK